MRALKVWMTEEEMTKTHFNFCKDFEDLDLPIHGVRLPSFEISSTYKSENKVSEDCSNYDFLKSLCYNGLKKKGISLDDKRYKDRLDYELKIVKKLTFVDYMLLVWDVINFCNENDIPVGLGRGSAAGSLILFSIGVTGIDPIKYGLIFERFISETRAKKKIVDGVTYLDGELMCDVDMDICYYNRQKVLEYLDEKFQGKTAKILTLNTLSGKLLIKECGKIVGAKEESEMNQVTSLIPKIFGQVQDLEGAYEEVDDLKKWCDSNKSVYQIAIKLKGLIKNKGVHPSGILLSYDQIEKSCPTELSSDKSTVSSYDMNWASIFNLKLDILGLRGVSVSSKACKSIGIKVEDIDLNDPNIYKNLQRLRHPHGLFQIEADLAFKVCNKVKPKNLEELSAVLALARPGAMKFVDQYAKYTNEGAYEPIHPFFDDILSSTGGVALYQEQLMQMAHKIGFTLDEAEILRRIVGKKKVAEARKWKKKISKKIEENKLDKEIGDILWAVLEDSANYSFNKSHSIAYAALAAVTVYLKFTYPKEFFLSLLKMSRHEPDPVSEVSTIQKELPHFDIQLLPPHILDSTMNFTIEGDNIRYGLLSIKGISEKSIERIDEFKNEYSNKFDIFQAAEDAKVNLGVLCALLQAGSLDGYYSQSRSKMVYEAQIWNILTAREKKWVYKFAEQYDYDLIKIIKKLISFQDEKGKPVIKESRVATMRKKGDSYKEIYMLNSKAEDFASWYYETFLLGYSYTTNLRNVFRRDGASRLTSIHESTSNENDMRVTVAGVVEQSISRISKNKNKYLKLVLSDETGKIESMLFSKKLDQCVAANTRLPKAGDVVIVKGLKKHGDTPVIWADVIGIQSLKVYTKLSQLKKKS